MGLAIYNVLLIVLVLPALMVALPILVLIPRVRFGILERLSFSRLPVIDSEATRIWIHAASVGEVQAVWRLVEDLRRSRPKITFLFTTLTMTGRRLATERLAGNGMARLAPLDFPGLPGRVMDGFRPHLLLVVETELWPNLFGAAARRGVPIVGVNGRISSRAHLRYRVIRPLLRSCLESADLFLTTDQKSAERYIDLGASPPAVVVSGNLKFDQSVPILSREEEERIRGALEWPLEAPVLLAASTHEGEEREFLRVAKALRQRDPRLRLILAPRHPDRIEAVASEVEAAGLSYRRLKALNGRKKSADLLLVDTLGDLGRLYSLASAVIVGGSFVPRGGHNLIEPALASRPVLFGPHVDNVREMAHRLIESGGGIQLSGWDHAESILADLLGGSERAAMGRRAREAAKGGQGATPRAVEAILKRLDREAGKRSTVVDRRGPVIRRWTADSNRACRFFGLVSIGVLSPLAFLNSAAVRLRRFLYRMNVFATIRVGRPVVSVGNLAVGGSGKTPAVIAVCESLIRIGRRPAVLSRGYGGRRGTDVLVVSDGKTTLARPSESGDEPFLIAKRLPGIPVVVGRNRVDAARAAIERFSPDVLVLDDGYQHLRIHRDLDLLLLDARQRPINRRVLPAGLFREPLSQARWADGILWSHADRTDRPDGLHEIAEQICPGKPSLTSRHHPVALIGRGGAERRRFQAISGRRVVAVAGIAEPSGFFDGLRDAGAVLIQAVAFPDHHPYSLKELDEIEAMAKRCDADWIVTTEKDWVRIGSASSLTEDWWVVEIQLVPDDQVKWNRLIERILKV